VAIKAVVELTAKPGRRAELTSLLQDMVQQGAGQPGFLGSTRFEVLDQPDVLIEIADWESAEARAGTCRRAPQPAPTRPCWSCWPRRSASR
jgi:quinol monooxygenase YgiN